MRTPFSNFTAPEQGLPNMFTPSLELESPLIDPEAVEQHHTYAATPVDENFIDAENETQQIDLEKAIRLNRKYEQELWGKQKEAIRKHLAAKGLLQDNTDSNPTNFAIAIAQWQAAFFRDRKNRDGILGPISWSLLAAQMLAAQPAQAIQTPSRWHGLIKGTVPAPAVPLVHGKATFQRMVQAIKTANNSGHYIYILGWMLDADFELIPGDPGSTLYNLLQGAAARSVEIRILIWDNIFYKNSIANAAAKINALTNALLLKDNATFGSEKVKNALVMVRAQVQMMDLKYGLLLNRLDKWKAFKQMIATLRNEGSHHEKVVVVKGSQGLTAFCGGIDINENRVKGIDLSNGSSTVLHDIHCEVGGHAAWTLLRRFIERWRVFRSESKAPHPLQLMVLRGEAEPRPQPVTTGPDITHVKLMHTYNHPSNRQIKDRSIRDMVRVAIGNARKSVYIEDQYMISLEIASWLNERLRNEPGLQSVILLTQDDMFAAPDLQFTQAMRKRFREILERGLNTHQKSKVRFNMLDPYVPPAAHHRVHSKLYVIDNELAIIGSANCSSRSMTNDTETAAVFFNDPNTTNGFVAQLVNANRVQNAIAYQPNKQVKDIDIAIVEELRTYSPILSPIAGPSLPVLIPQIAALLINKLRPALIDIIDPDADQTPLQQEYEVEELTDAETHAAAVTTESVMPGVTNMETWEEENAGLEQFTSPDETESGQDGAAAWNEQENSATEQSCHFANDAWMQEEAPEHDLYPHPEENEIAAEMEHQATLAGEAGAQAKPCEGRTCWAKLILNQQLGLALQGNNVVDEATKTAVASFQKMNNLPITQRLDAATERALLEADALRRTKGTVWEAAAASVISAAKTKIEDWTGKAVNNKPQHILNSYRDPRRLYAFVLHQMAFKRRNPKTGEHSDPQSYLSTGAHFCILFDGRIIQLHPCSRMIWHGNCLSPRSVGVEFEGNFPDIKGKWWIHPKAKVPDKDMPTQAQFDSGKFLTSYLKATLGTTHILAHRQGSNQRDNDPGPHIWCNVGQWAIDKLGLTDGGPSFKCGMGSAILPQWRTWGSKASATVQQEFAGEYTDMEDESMEWEAASGNHFNESEGIDPDEADQHMMEANEENEETEEFIEEESPEFEHYSLGYKLSKLSDWVHLLKFKVPDEIVARLKRRNMLVQYAHNESYSNDLNADFYRLRIDRFPAINGNRLNAQTLIRYIRLNINKLVDTAYCDFHPYDPVIDTPVWAGENPVGAVLRLNIKGPDNASVVVSLAQPHGWRFTTVTTPGTGRHPVSGHREFFIAKDPSTGGTYFIIKGLDMLSTGIAGLGLPNAGRWGYKQGDLLWRSMREKLIQFINANGGSAHQDITYSERIEWRFVYYQYKKLLEDSFGKGAGSAKNSSFFSFQLAE